jgi:SAM-dependent methyltransferase
MPSPAPAQLDALAGRFGLPSVVAAYEKRAAYPPETERVLLGLLADGPGAVLDLGCGPGTLARRLAPAVERVDAVDLSAEMIAVGRGLPGGDHPAIRWVQGPAETVPLEGPYRLAVAGTSLHWMRCEVLLPRLRALLAPDAVLALVAASRSTPWAAEERRLLARHATVHGHLPEDVAAEVEGRGLFRRLGEHVTAPATVRQGVEAYVEGFHSREAFCREALGAEGTAAFHDAFRRLLAPHARGGRVAFTVRARIVWGRPA